ncbi:uncharacterized protein [Henckelia pumila]|uniref:uncharacterized protein isoform X3 n=1 Tax=Henckelia pumila TaxID=405737 RepID=UPI003C6E50BB
MQRRTPHLLVSRGRRSAVNLGQGIVRFDGGRRRRHHPEAELPHRQDLRRQPHHRRSSARRLFGPVRGPDVREEPRSTVQMVPIPTDTALQRAHSAALVPPGNRFPPLWHRDTQGRLPYLSCFPSCVRAPRFTDFTVGLYFWQIVKEDKALVYQDWKECIIPLLSSASLKLNPEFFSVDEYLAAKSLIASRSFQIDEYHGYGMVPLADLFNHKTAAEDVHFTSVSYYSESDIDSDNQKRDSDDEKNGDDEHMAQDFHSEMGGFRSGLEFESSSASGNDVMVMQMIICEDVNSGAEVFNTYGSLSNAALLHRYGFTEPNNPFDILNMDLEIVLQWSSSVFSCRHSRRRLSLWRKLGYSGCDGQNSVYFEITFHGEPQVELLVLLNIILLPEEVFHELELALLSVGNSKQITSRHGSFVTCRCSRTLLRS